MQFLTKVKKFIRLVENPLLRSNSQILFEGANQTSLEYTSA